MRNIKIIDPDTGVVYPSIKAAAEARGLKLCTVYQRLACGCSPEVALSRGNLHHTPSQDHTGARFATTADMCQHWGIPVDCFRQRFEIRGWTLERSLTEPVGRSNASGHRVKGTRRAHVLIVDGVEYPSIREAAKAFGVNLSTVYNRLAWHDPVKKALRPSRGKLGVWYKGVHYHTKLQLARELQIPVNKLDFLEGVSYD